MDPDILKSEEGGALRRPPWYKFWRNIFHYYYKISTISKFANALIRKEKKRSYISEKKKQNWQQLDFLL